MEKIFFKSKGKRLGLLFLFVLCSMMAVFSMQVSASKEKGVLVSDETDAFEQIFENPRKQGLVFEITYPEEKMEFLIREPDGTFLKPYTERPGVSWEKTASGIRLTMEEARKGSFFLRYPSLYTSDIKVVVRTLRPEMSVRDFKAGTISDGQLPYEFRLEAESSFWYSYQLYLCRKDVAGTELLLYEGEGYANRSMTGKSAVSGIPSGTYVLKLCVDVKQREEQKFVSESEIFSYQTEEKVEPLDKYEVVVKPEENMVIVDWSKAETAIYDAVLVEMKTKEGIIYRQKIPKNQGTSCTLCYGQEVDAEISLTNCFGEQRSAPVRRTINPAGGEVLSLPKSSISKEDMWTFSYHTDQPVTLTLTGGEIEKDKEINGEGSEGIQITGDPFAASVSYVDAQGVCWKYERMLRVDKEPPELSVSEIYDGYETRLERLDLRGTTEEEAAVTFNGEAILNDKGYFSVPFVLKEGENPYCIEVHDEAGNVTRMEGNVIRLGALEYMSRKETNPVLHLMAGHPAAFIAGSAGILVVLLFVLGFVFCRRWHKITERTREKLGEERSEEEKKWISVSRKQKHMNMCANLVMGLAILATICFFCCGMVAGYAGQISQRAADENALPNLISDVYHIRITVGEMNQAVRVLFFVMLVLYLISIFLKMMASMMRRRLDTLPEDVIRREEQKLHKKQERQRRKEEKALRRREKKAAKGQETEKPAGDRKETESSESDRKEENLLENMVPSETLISGETGENSGENAICEKNQINAVFQEPEKENAGKERETFSENEEENVKGKSEELLQMEKKEREEDQTEERTEDEGL